MLARTGKLKVPSHASVGLVREGTDLESLEPRYAMSLRNKNLHLTMLGLYRLPDHVFTLSHLLRLDVGHNELSELSPAIGQLAKLEELWLNDNPIAALPTEIQFCKKLKCIDLRNTDLATVPRELGRLRNLNEIDLTNTPYEASLAAQHLFTSPIDTDRLMSYLDVQDKRATLRLDMFERACAGVYREIADVPAQRDFISDLVAAVSDEFPDLPDMRNVVRNCDRLLPADPGLHPPELAARRIRAQFTGLRRENDKKRLSAELELKMRALYYDNIDPAAVEGYIRSIYVAEDDEKALELEDIQFLIKNAARLLPASPGEIDGRAVRSSVWDLQQQLTDERTACVDDVCKSLISVYPDAEPPLVEALGKAVCDQFKRERFATKKELAELKKLSADAGALFPPEIQNAEPRQIKYMFREKEHQQLSGVQA